MVCGQTPADCLNCGRAVCVWDKPESPKSRTWWTPETYRAVGDVLRSERTRLQYNQREMAQHLGVTYTAYRAWEQGCCCPQPSNWRRLVRHIRGRNGRHGSESHRRHHQLFEREGESKWQ